MAVALFLSCPKSRMGLGCYKTASNWYWKLCGHLTFGDD
jgi:hypothetical protein